MLTKSNEKALGLVFQHNRQKSVMSSELQKLDPHDWYSNIIYYLLNMTCPNHVVRQTRRALRLKASKYCIIQDGLGWRNLDGLVFRCVDEEKFKELVKEFHSRFCGGHYATKTTTHKILKVGYCWPTIFSDVHSFVRGCEQCQLFTGKRKLAALPLKPVVTKAPFQQWGLILLDSLRII